MKISTFRKGFVICLILLAIIITYNISKGYIDYNRINPTAEFIGKALYNGELLCYDWIKIRLDYENDTLDKFVSTKEVCNNLWN
mgnify:CR=1 FL=1